MAILNRFNNILVCNCWDLKVSFMCGGCYLFLKVEVGWVLGGWFRTDLLGCAPGTQDCHPKGAPQGSSAPSPAGGREVDAHTWRADSCPSGLKIFCAQLRNRQTLSRDTPISVYRMPPWVLSKVRRFLKIDVSVIGVKG